MSNGAPRRNTTLWLIVALAAAPVVASYLFYYFWPPTRTVNYGALIEPRPLPDPPLALADGTPFQLSRLKGKWVLVSVDSGRCDEGCERMLFMQRQLREMLGKDRDRLDKLVLVPDDVALTPAQVDALTAHGAPATVLRAPCAGIEGWLMAAPGHRMGEHLFLVDPMGRWMLRTPATPEPSAVKKDLERLMRANAGWDKPGR